MRAKAAPGQWPGAAGLLFGCQMVGLGLALLLGLIRTTRCALLISVVVSVGIATHGAGSGLVPV